MRVNPNMWPFIQPGHWVVFMDHSSAFKDAADLWPAAWTGCVLKCKRRWFIGGEFYKLVDCIAGHPQVEHARILAVFTEREEALTYDRAYMDIRKKWHDAGEEAGKAAQAAFSRLCVSGQLGLEDAA